MDLGVRVVRSLDAAEIRRFSHIEDIWSIPYGNKPVQVQGEPLKRAPEHIQEEKPAFRFPDPGSKLSQELVARTMHVDRFADGEPAMEKSSRDLAAGTQDVSR